VSVVDIRLFGDPVLRSPAAPVVDFDKQLRTLVQDLTDTMMDAPGVGLAAPQLGSDFASSRTTSTANSGISSIPTSISATTCRRKRKAVCRCPT